MKNIIILFLVFSGSLLAQDTINLRNGSQIVAKVNEINETDIKYNRFDNLNGPLYVVEIAEVKSIRFKNGSEDVFSLKEGSPKKQSLVLETNIVTESNFQKIDIRGKSLNYNRKGLDNRELFEIIKAYPEPKRRDLLIREFYQVQAYRKKHNNGLALLFGGMAFSIVSLTFNEPLGPAAFFVGTGTSIIGSVISNVNRNKHNAQRVKLARIYNGEEYVFK